MSSDRIVAKLQEYQLALQSFIERVEEDNKILAAVLVGSLNEETIWRKESIHLWLIETDGVTKRLRFDGNEERIFRTFVEEGINIHVELIPRVRFRKMVEGNARTAFSCNFFAAREIIFCRDASIKKWFQQANSVAVKDQEKERLTVMTWVIWEFNYLRKRLEFDQDQQLARLDLLDLSHAIAAYEVVEKGEVYEGDLMPQGLRLNPDLMDSIFSRTLARKPSRKFLDDSLNKVAAFIEDKATDCFSPIIRYIKREKRTVAFSEICDHFAHSQLYPWHLEQACDWLADQGELEKDCSPFKMTKKSRSDVEEPAYLYPN